MSKNPQQILGFYEFLELKKKKSNSEEAEFVVLFEPNFRFWCLGKVLIKSFKAIDTASASKFLSVTESDIVQSNSLKTLRAQQISSSKSIWQSICGAFSEDPEQIDSHTTPTSLILWCGNFQKCLLTWSSNFHGFLVVISGERVLQNEGIEKGWFWSPTTRSSFRIQLV